MTSGHDTSAVQTRWKAVITLALATLIVASELTLAAFALPLISLELGVTPAATAWVLLAYTLPLVAMAIPAGRWVDGADVRLVFLLSLVLVGLASVLAALAPTFAVLMAGRALQGLASALYLAVYMPVLSITVHAAQRGRAISVTASLMMLGSVALAPLGGIVAESLGWRAVFLIKLPMIVVALWLGYQTLPRVSRQQSLRQRLPLPHRSMWLETLLIGAGMTALLMMFEIHAQRWWIMLALFGAGALVLYGWSQLEASRPVMELVRQRRFGLSALALMSLASIIGLMSFTLPFFVVDVMLQGPDAISVALLGFVLAGALASPVAGGLADRFGALNIATLGAGMSALGLLSLLTLDASATLFELTVRTAATGIGMAVFNAPVMTAMMNAAPSDRMGTASGVSSLARMLGSTLGPALAAMAWRITGGGVAGMHGGVLALAGMTLVGFLALLWARRQPETGASPVTAPATD